MHLPKKRITKTTKKTNGVSSRSEYFCECVCMTLRMTAAWWFVCVSNILVCTSSFVSFFCCLPRCMKHKRPFLSLFFCSDGNFCILMSSVCPFSKQGLDLYVLREWREKFSMNEWMNVCLRAREGNCTTHPFLSPALHPQIDEIEMHTFVNTIFALLTRWPPLVYFP